MYDQAMLRRTLKTIVMLCSFSFMGLKLFAGLSDVDVECSTFWVSMLVSSATAQC